MGTTHRHEEARINAMPTAYVAASDVSNAVLFLVSDSDESRFTTGTHLKVDAGALAKRGQ